LPGREPWRHGRKSQVGRDNDFRDDSGSSIHSPRFPNVALGFGDGRRVDRDGEVARVKPPPFAYVAPDSVEGVVRALTEGGEDAKVIAGGQSLMPILALRLGRPSVLVDIGRVPGLDVVATDADGALVLGTGVTHAMLGRNALIARRAPLLAEVSPLIAHAAIRNRGTVGGSLAHNDPAAELPALSLLMDATVVVEGPSGRRSVTAEDLFVSYLTTSLAPDEMLTEVRIPDRGNRVGDAFAEVSRRHGDFALVGAGARIRLDAVGRVAEARLVFIGVGGIAVLDRRTAADLIGTMPGSDGLAHVASVAAARLEPHDDLHASASYRRRVAATLGVRVLTRALERAVATPAEVSL
jgi:carbon-monoxide dehydrogenase medium subunit